MNDSTKIIWCGEECILITDRKTQKPLVLLRKYEVKELIEEWGNKK